MGVYEEPLICQHAWDEACTACVEWAGDRILLSNALAAMVATAYHEGTWEDVAAALRNYYAARERLGPLFRVVA